MTVDAAAVAPRSVRVFGIDTAVRPMLVRRAIGYVPQALSADDGPATS